MVSPAETHDYLRTVMIAPMMTGSRTAPFRVPVTFGGKQGLILRDQIRTLDQRRLAKRLGTVSNKTLVATLSTLQESFTE